MKDRILAQITKLPLWLNRFLMKLNINPNFIYGNDYGRYKKFVKKNYSQYDNEQNLLDLVNYAIKSVPFYAKKYKKINTINDFKTEFGFIDKDIISENLNNFISTEIDLKDYVLGTTGGTSGNPLKMYLPKDRHIFELGTIHNMWEEVDFKHNIRAVIRNKRLNEDQDYIINPITKEIIFDGFRLNEDYFFKIYKILKSYNIKFIHAYPSNAYSFSKFLYKHKLDVSFIKSFLSGSENVSQYQIDFIKNKLGINFYTWFGHSEKLVLGGFCKNSNVYHIEPTYGYFELLDENGKDITTPGKIGEIVGTTLHNKGMPLIRYKTDDFAEYVGNYCPHCNRHLILVKNIQGRRSGSKIYGGDGSITTATALNFHDDLYLYISGIQYIQEEKGILDVLIIKGDNFNEKIDKRLNDYYKSKFSSDTIINIKYVEKLIKKPNGKFVDLISKIKEY